MPKLLTKGAGLLRSPVITKIAAIFLLITLFIGSTAQAFDMEYVDGTIAADSTMMLGPLYASNDVVDPTMIGLPKQVYQTPFFVPQPTIFQANQTDRKVDEAFPLLRVSDETQAASRTPSFSGIITSRYGYRKHPVRGKVKHHNGVDIAAKHGAPVLAPANGVVTFSGVRGGYGKVIEIDHQNGFTSLLAHNSTLHVGVGDLVEAGKVIARAGRTGMATGVHIHLEIRRHGLLVNPITFFTPHTH